MDTVNWSQQRFLEIANKLSTFLRQAGFREGDVSFIPCSGLNGVNLVKPVTDIPEFSWYTKTPLITEIGQFLSAGSGVVSRSFYTKVVSKSSCAKAELFYYCSPV